MDENLLYDRRSCSTDSKLSGEEPIYNEALNPAMLTQTVFAECHDDYIH